MQKVLLQGNSYTYSNIVAKYKKFLTLIVEQNTVHRKQNTPIISTESSTLSSSYLKNLLEEFEYNKNQESTKTAYQQYLETIQQILDKA